MHKFPISNYKQFSEVPLDQLRDLNFAVYITDFNWDYLFVNTFAVKNVGPRAANLLGKNMWKAFPELAQDPTFGKLRESMEMMMACQFDTISPVNGKRLYVTGYPLQDCFYFTSSVVPDKQELLNELRQHLAKRR
jgi:hypothetical protein